MYFEDDLMEEDDLFIGRLIGGLGSLLGGASGFEDEDAFEEDLFEEEDFFEDEGEGMEAEEAAALMEMLADEVAGASSFEEADQFLPFLGALAPLAMRALPAAARILPRAVAAGRRVVPQLARGLVGLGRRMARSPTGRRLVRTLPTIARQTAADVLRRTARGQPLTGQAVARSLARQTANVLRNPQRRQAAARRSQRVARTARQGLQRHVTGQCRCR